jgi:hypothetical protein
MKHTAQVLKLEVAMTLLETALVQKHKASVKARSATLAHERQIKKTRQAEDAKHEALDAKTDLKWEFDNARQDWQRREDNYRQEIEMLRQTVKNLQARSAALVNALPPGTVMREQKAIINKVIEIIKSSKGFDGGAVNKIDSLKKVRETYGLGLKEAKDLVEQVAFDAGIMWHGTSQLQPPQGYNTYADVLADLVSRSVTNNDTNNDGPTLPATT